MNKYCKFIIISRRGIIKPIDIGAIFCNILLPEDVIRIGLYPDSDSIIEDFNKLKNIVNGDSLRSNRSSFYCKGKDNRTYRIHRENHHVSTEYGYERYKNIQEFKNVDEFLNSDRNNLI